MTTGIAYIYVIGTSSTNPEFPVLCKIGQTNSPMRRYYEIRTSYDRLHPKLPFYINGMRVWSCAAGDAPRIERFIHQVLGEYRYMGEWFNLPLDIQKSLAEEDGSLKCPWATEEVGRIANRAINGDPC
jgi:hypothetical protein